MVSMLTAYPFREGTCPPGAGAQVPFLNDAKRLLEQFRCDYLGQRVNGEAHHLGRRRQ
jgi:hypothetical protein